VVALRLADNAKAFIPSEVRGIRDNLKMTQSYFASAIGVSKNGGSVGAGSQQAKRHGGAVIDDCGERLGRV
jgi:hypothetical protein